jgi:hypothetical protein
MCPKNRKLDFIETHLIKKKQEQEKPREKLNKFRQWAVAINSFKKNYNLNMFLFIYFY